MGLDLDPNMIDHPRSNSYVRMDEWDQEVAKWNARHGDKAEGEDEKLIEKAPAAE